MKSSIEPVEGNKVKLSITVEEAEFEPAIDTAWKAIAREVRLPGFRPGRVPRKVLESRFGPSYGRAHAIENGLSEFYLAAVCEHDVEPIAQASLDLTAGEDGGDVAFDAVVPVRPEIELAGYQGLTVTVPSPHPTDDDIADQVEAFRGQYGELADVERPAASGDIVVIDIAGSRDGEPVEGLVAEGYSYEDGSGRIVPELDDHLRGLKAGETTEFDAAHPDPNETEGVHFAVTVETVRERVLPELTDSWIADATEFETVADFRDDVIDRLTRARRSQSSTAVQNELGNELAKLVEGDVPEALIGSEMRARLENLVQRLAQQGIDLETYLRVTGTEATDFTESIRNDSEHATKVDLALRAIARLEGLVPDDEALDLEIERRERQLLAEVERARGKLELGGYGVSEKSGLPIPYRRLAALPWARDAMGE